MDSDNESGDPLDDIAGIRRVVDRLRNLVISATILDLRATADGYGAERSGTAG